MVGSGVAITPYPFSSAGGNAYSACSPTWTRCSLMSTVGGRERIGFVTRGITVPGVGTQVIYNGSPLYVLGREGQVLPRPP